jgi:hypothetical protein
MRWAGLLARFALLCPVFYFLARFSLAQATALAITIGLILGSIGVRDVDRFSPFQLLICPNWSLVFRQHGVLQSEAREEFGELLRRIEAFDVRARRLIESGLRLTFLQPDLIYFHEDDYFSSRLDVRTKLLAENEFLTPFLGFYCELRADRDFVGYEFGLVTPDSMGRRAHEYDRADRLSFARVPSDGLLLMFPGYPEDRWSSRWRKRANARIETAGWKLGDSPTRWEHPNCTIYYTDL